MASSIDAVTLALPRSALSDLPALSQTLTDRMHELLERNTEGTLGAVEREELETLVGMAQFAQILAMAAHSATSP